MPTVLRVGRYRFHFFSNEGREPPHIHVKAGDDEAKFWLEPIQLAANNSFHSRELTEIVVLISQHHRELLNAWNEHFNQS
jgi:hypothetical protein